MPTTNIVDKNGVTVDASTVTKPSDRHFRGAWVVDSDKKVISEDMTEAKKIFQEKIREVRKPLLEAEDVVYMKALEPDDASAKTASVAKKKALRDAPEECSKVTVPDPNWLACALQGGILPPVEVYWLLAEDEAKPDFKKHTRGYLLHNTKPVEAMTEEQAIEYLIMKDIPQRVWRNYDKANKPRLVICKKNQLPSTREWRNAWKIDEETVATNKAA